MLTITTPHFSSLHGDHTTHVNITEVLAKGFESLVRVWAIRKVAGVPLSDLGNEDHSMITPFRGSQAKAFATKKVASGYKKSSQDRITLTMCAAIYGTRFISNYVVLLSGANGGKAFSSTAKGKMGAFGIQPGMTNKRTRPICITPS